MKKIIMIASIASLSITLEACTTSNPINPITTYNENTKIIGDSWEKGNSLVKRGNRLIEKGRDQISDGEEQIKEGEEQVISGENNIEQGEEMVGKGKAMMQDSEEAFEKFISEQALKKSYIKDALEK